MEQSAYRVIGYHGPIIRTVHSRQVCGGLKSIVIFNVYWRNRNFVECICETKSFVLTTKFQQFWFGLFKPTNKHKYDYFSHRLYRRLFVSSGQEEPWYLLDNLKITKKAMSCKQWHRNLFWIFLLNWSDFDKISIEYASVLLEICWYWFVWWLDVQ